MSAAGMSRMRLDVRRLAGPGKPRRHLRRFGIKM
jgi:hypothetical protein